MDFTQNLHKKTNLHHADWLIKTIQHSNDQKSSKHKNNRQICQNQKKDQKIEKQTAIKPQPPVFPNLRDAPPNNP